MPTQEHVKTGIFPQCVSYHLFRKDFCRHGFWALTGIDSIHNVCRERTIQRIGGEREVAGTRISDIGFNCSWRYVQNLDSQRSALHGQHLTERMHSCFTGAVDTIPWCCAVEEDKMSTASLGEVNHQRRTFHQLLNQC